MRQQRTMMEDVWDKEMGERRELMRREERGCRGEDVVLSLREMGREEDAERVPWRERPKEGILQRGRDMKMFCLPHAPSMASVQICWLQGERDCLGA